MNDEYTGDLEPIRDLLPVRVTKPGVKVNHKEILADDDWIYPLRNPQRYKGGRSLGGLLRLAPGWSLKTSVIDLGAHHTTNKEGGL